LVIRNKFIDQCFLREGVHITYPLAPIFLLNLSCLDHDIDMRGLHDDRCGVFHGERNGVGHGKEAWRTLGLPWAIAIDGGKSLLGKVYRWPARWARPHYRHRAGACGSVGSIDYYASLAYFLFSSPSFFKYIAVRITSIH